ncbi:MAG: alkaline phosphatase PhoX [Bacteroidota bacterium]
MRKIYALLLAFFMCTLVDAQIHIEYETQANWLPQEVVLPPSPLRTQVIFIGGTDYVQTTPTYGNPADSALAKEWHDFIGFTPDEDTDDLGWVSVNHERILADDKIGDGGGMTVFKVRRNEETGLIEVVNQALNDGRSGKFFNVDFVNTTGETGMNCGGITSSADGRIWTAEEWFRSSNTSIADRDTGMFTIGTGTATTAAPAGFPGFNGETIQKYQNYNYMTEIDPKQAVAVRKQYNWGRQAFEGGVVMPDNQTVYLGVDATPGFFTRFIADTPGDFTSGTTSVYKHDGTPKWIEIDNTDISKMLNYADEAVAVGATMYNRLEWVAYNPADGNVYLTETGRDNPASRWADELSEGAVFAPHHITRAKDQDPTWTPDSSGYWDYYGRVLKFDVASDEMTVALEGGPYLPNGASPAAYPEKHLSNPDGLSFMTVNGRSYMIVQEDLNGTSFGRMPDGISNRACELFLLDMTIADPTYDDLVRVTTMPIGSEVTGAVATPDGKTLFVNSQHPSSDNPFPYNHSLTVAISGWNEFPTSLEETLEEGLDFSVYPNPVARTLYFKEVTDVEILTMDGRRVKVARNTDHVNVQDLTPGTYIIRNKEGIARKLIVQ